jgi:UPF0042 nucleotide-binding protein
VTVTGEVPAEGRVRLVLITGLAGSGKSTVAKCLEDLGYYVVDNLPLPLLAQFLEDPLAFVGGRRNLAVVADHRAQGVAQRLPELLESVDRERITPTLLFLEAGNERLVRRFSETRRPHPVAAEQGLLDAIAQEREDYSELRGLADMVFDTSEWSIHELRAKTIRAFACGPEGAPEMQVSLSSFGFKYGVPYGADLLFDVRFLPNPYFVPELREHTGLEEPIQEFLAKVPDFHELRQRLRDLLLYLLPRYRSENRAYLTVAIGCTGGKHRSVAICERLRDDLETAGWKVRLEHRDVER